jgi:hypothetical protein
MQDHREKLMWGHSKKAAKAGAGGSFTPVILTTPEAKMKEEHEASPGK